MENSNRPIRQKKGKSNSIWLTNEENLHFKKIAEKEKTSISSAIKYAALNRKLKIQHKTIIKTDPCLLFELNKIGCNINQIARQLNKMSTMENFNQNDTQYIFENFRVAISELKQDMFATVRETKKEKAA